MKHKNMNGARKISRTYSFKGEKVSTPMDAGQRITAEEQHALKKLKISGAKKTSGPKPYKVKNSLPGPHKIPKAVMHSDLKRS